MEGTGTTFHLRLPQTRVTQAEHDQPEFQTEYSEEDADGAGLTALIAEDSGPLLKSLANMLEQSGFRVLTADNGAGALEVAYKRRPDILVLDVDMPIMNGLTALQCYGHAAPAVVISGAPIQEDSLPQNTRVLENSFTAQQLNTAINEQLCRVAS